MMIPLGQEESYEARKKRRIESAHRKAETLNSRIKMFINDIEKSHFIKKSEKNKIIEKVLKNIE